MLPCSCRPPGMWHQAYKGLLTQLLGESVTRVVSPLPWSPALGTMRGGAEGQKNLRTKEHTGVITPETPAFRLSAPSMPLARGAPEEAVRGADTWAPSPGTLLC